MAVIKLFDRQPNVGDALFIVGGVKTWVRYCEAAPSGGTFVGVVFLRDGHKVYVLNKSGASLQYKTENTADGPSSYEYYRKDGSIANYRGIMNIARGVAYWGPNGRTPSANETIPAAYNSDPVSRSAFEGSSYCSLLRKTYASYESYIGEGMGVKFPQEYGCFGLAGGKEITYQYNNAQHPAFQHCAAVNYGVAGLSAGDWYLPGVWEGTALMQDKTLASVAATMTKFGGTAPNNSTDRWFAQRFNDTHAWFFGGVIGFLSSSSCTYAFMVQAVSLLIV